ncbi:MAG TPA: single-stranded DNA-binding protein [Oligoflexia bacterium]|nr:single-stranded DNA-binding protein [Oligoflexia bacterium]HMP26755.1 single-stranded DNA-binding protein [Oligoflexia bacterium]
MSLNKVLLIGNLGKDPESRSTPGGLAVSRFSVATTERRKDESGSWKDQTEWHNVVVFGRTAENCSQYLKKGSQVFIEGKITTRKWQDKEGKDRWTTEIIGNTVQFLGKRSGTDGASAPLADDGFENKGVEILDSLPTGDALLGSAKSSPAGLATTPIADIGFDEDDIPF